MLAGNYKHILKYFIQCLKTHYSLHLQHAIVLLEEALSKREWLIARDIVRFLRAIDPSDIGRRPRTPSCQKAQKNKASMATRRYTTDDSAETDAFVFGSYNPPGIVSW